MTTQGGGNKERGGAVRQMATYLLVGLISAGIELAIFQALLHLVGWSVLASNASALTLSTVFNFCANRTFTFKDTSNPLRSLVLYLLLFAANTVASTFIVQALMSGSVNSALAKLAAMACVVIWDFFLYRKVIFV